MKISIITVTYNCAETINYTLNSIKLQDYKNIEHIVIDGDSKDGTKEIIKKKIDKNKIFISEPDTGIYEAMNKGIKLASGEIIGILNSGDVFNSKKTISKCMAEIKKNYNNSDIFIGDVIYFKNDINIISRFYKGSTFKKWMLYFGMMPPHTGTFIKNKIYNKLGLYYNERFKIASDFELFLKIFLKSKISYSFLNIITTRMKTGGKSGENLFSYFLTTREILTAFKINGIYSNIFFILLRIPSKIIQIIRSFFLNLKILEKINITNKNKEIIKVLRNMESLYSKKRFILSALNLAFLGSILSNKIINDKNLICWTDGLFAKKLIKKKFLRIPGRIMLRNLEIQKFKIKKIHVIGNLPYVNKKFLIKNYKLPIRHSNLPYDNINIIKNYLPIIYSDELIFLTVPTPKQEQIAYFLSKKYEDYKIICIGGSLSMASGHEKIVPLFLEKYSLEFIWRLRTDTLRRIFRLINTLYNYARYQYYIKKFKVVQI
jgi:glycosyltransferase involved in cell wall biosynthesis